MDNSTMDNENSSTPAVAGDRPTSAAYVTLTTSPEGPALSMSVPVEHTGRMLEALVVAFGALGSIGAPYVMAQALEATHVNAPWQMSAILLVVSALLPMVHLFAGRRVGRCGGTSSSS